MKNPQMKLCNETIHPGESLSLALPLPQLFSCAPLYMPIKLMHGKEEGPCLLIIASLHGNEINGTEIIHRLLSLPSLRKLKGTIIAVPVLNVLALINRNNLTHTESTLARHFPGHPHGSNEQRLAHIFTTEILSKANYCINLRTAPLNYSNLPLLYLNETVNSRPLAEAFNAPILVEGSDTNSDTLAQTATEKGIPYLTYTGGEAMRFNEAAIRVGVSGLAKIMVQLGMIENEKKPVKQRQYLVARDVKWITASRSGINHSKHKLGKIIKKNECLSIIKDPFGTADDFKLYSPKEGVIVGKNNNPLVHEGDNLFQLALLADNNENNINEEMWI